MKLFCLSLEESNKDTSVGSESQLKEQNVIVLILTQLYCLGMGCSFSFLKKQQNLLLHKKYILNLIIHKYKLLNTIF